MEGAGLGDAAFVRYPRSYEPTNDDGNKIINVYVKKEDSSSFSAHQHHHSPDVCYDTALFTLIYVCLAVV